MVRSLNPGGHMSWIRQTVASLSILCAPLGSASRVGVFLGNQLGEARTGLTAAAGGAAVGTAGTIAVSRGCSKAAVSLSDDAARNAFVQTDQLAIRGLSGA